jgi:hypothetical protein
MCFPFDPISCVLGPARGIGNGIAAAAQGTFDSTLSGINDTLHAGIKAMMTTLAGWLLVPSTQVCPGADQPGSAWLAGCAGAASPAAQLRAWTLPITILVATMGLLWQAIMLTVSRKGEPLVQALRGLGTVALWSAVGIVGTQLALRASDDYTVWILRQAIFGNSANPTETLGTALAGLAPVQSYNALILLIVFDIPILFITVAQIILMIFREGSVVILSGLLQLAAAGSFTRLTSGWLSKVTGWMLALICYKPIAASVYATAFALLGADGLRNSIMGLAVLLLAIIAMPATMKFFNWTTGTLAQSPSTLGMLGTAGAAGIHAASSMRGVGGYHVGDHAEYMAQHGPDGGGGAGSGGDVTSSMSSMLTAPTGSTGAATTGAGAAGSAAAAAGSAAAGAATGGATLAAQAGVAAADTLRQAADGAVNAAGDAMQGR